MEKIFDLQVLSNSGIQKMADIGIFPFFLILICSLMASLFISHLYVKFYGSKGTGSTLHRAFPLLGVAITAIFVSLQFSIPLSLGLLGALSIVRFRTPIKDPEEVGFILLVIATSITCATFNMPFLILIMFVSILGLWILKKDKRLFRKKNHEGMIISKIPQKIYDEKNNDIMQVFKSNIVNPRVDSITESNDECTISYIFEGLDEVVISKMRSELNLISDQIRINVFFNQNQNQI